MLDVGCVVVGLDHRARAAVQAAMRRLAETGDTRSKEGLSRMLAGAIDELLSVRASWTHGHAERSSLPPADAQRVFGELAHRARSRFDVEVIRAEQGSVLRQAAPALPDSDEPGVVLVTLLVASKHALAISSGDTRDALASALGALRIGADALVAIEVVWSPAEERDRVSASAIERRHPEIRRLPA